MTTTNDVLRVAVEINTAEAESLCSRKVVLKLRTHFGGWEEHRVVLPAAFRELQMVSRREARVSRLELGLLLNEAVLQVRDAGRSISPPSGSIRFRRAPRTYAPWRCIVRVVSQTK